jgi:hypothetical protein
MWWLLILLLGWFLFCGLLVLTAVIMGSRRQVCQEYDDTDEEKYFSLVRQRLASEQLLTRHTSGLTSTKETKIHEVSVPN